jgi:predicted house-cleaning noncanonical NTP pyrophosphatase (MazG superfamily)
MKLSIIYFTAILLIFSSCKTEKKVDCPTVDYVNSFLAENKEVVFYGGIGIDDLINKTGILNIGSVGQTFGEQIDEVKMSLALDERIYFALEGPLSRDGMPKSFYFFVNVRSKEKVNELLTENGYFFEEEEGVMIAEDVTSAIGYTNDLIIAVSSEYGEDVKKLLLDAFKEANAKKSNENIAQNLARTGDLLFVSHLENLYATSNTDLNKLPEEKQKELQEMAKNTHVATTLAFEKGRMVLETFTNFNENMEKFAIFDESGSANVKSKLGPGTGYAAMAINLDMNKIDAIIQEYNPDIMEELYREMGPTASLIKGITGDRLSSIMSGAFGVALLSKPGSMEFAKDPKMHLYAGMGKSSEMIANLFADLLSAGDVQKLADGVYQMDRAIAKIEKNEMVMWSGMDAKDGEISFQNLDVPSNIPSFGDKPFSMYIDLSEMDIDNLGVDPMMAELSQMGDFISLEADNSGGKLIVQLKNTKDNFLNAFVKSYQSEIESLSDQGLAF